MLDSNEEKILQEILNTEDSDEYFGISEIAAKVDLSRQYVGPILKKLVEEGLIQDITKPYMVERKKGTKAKLVIKNRSRVVELLDNARTRRNLTKLMEEGEVKDVKIPFTKLLLKTFSSMEGLSGGQDAEFGDLVGGSGEKYPLINMTMVRNSPHPDPDELVKNWRNLDWLLVLLLFTPLKECFIKKKDSLTMDDVRKLSYQLVIDVDFSNFPPEFLKMIYEFPEWFLREIKLEEDS